MPNWKKVIVSGSDAALKSLNVTTSLTASGLIYPATDGIDGQVLKTDGLGNLFFENTTITAISIKNVSGVTIAKGTPCYITGSGTSGNVTGVIAADASNPLLMPAGVIAGEALNNGDEGIGLINGFINGVNTSAFTSGDQVYVAVGGGYTNVAPTGSALVQKLGNVEKSAVNGSGVINGPGATRSVPNINPGHLWVGNSDWVATAIATSSIQNVVSSSFASTASYATKANQITPGGTTGYIPLWSSNTQLGNSVIYEKLGSIGIDTGPVSSHPGKLTINGTGTTALVVTGSTVLSGSFTSYGTFISIDTNGVPSADLNARILRDNAGSLSIGYRDRYLYNSSTVTLDWKNSKLIDRYTSQSANWDLRLLTDSTEATSLDWNSRRAYGNGGTSVTIDWGGLALTDTGGGLALDWRNRLLCDDTGTTRIEYNTSATISQINHYAYNTNIIGLSTESEPLANYSNYGNTFLPAGEILTGVSFGVGVSDYDLVSLTANGDWNQSSSTSQDATKMLGIAFNVGTTNSVLLEGSMVVSSGSNGAPKISDLVIGKPVYLNTTSSGIFMSNTVPVVTNQFVRILGHVYYISTNDSTWYLMKFRPSHDWVLL